MSFLLQYENKLEIDTSPDSTESFKTLAKGINTMEADPNEEQSQDRYFDGDGFAETDVIGAQLILSVEGHRYYGDPAQDFIFAKQVEVGPARRTNFRLTLPDGATFEGPCTIANIVGPGGAAGEKGAISFEIHFNKKPEYTPGP
ncbi:phage tail tube protein [Alkalibacillus almallahensis]|uniref:phage tail tube protein n=1 Tax=Alkalibacillus almallahensis TaxID=1379154 RepID=UPI00141E9454|nr:capsid protein [Alkalibacillus almallahensis]NIK12873.1 hypothetical protein [Alkalibacillus almallahensis]